MDKNDRIFRQDAITALNCDMDITGKENAQKVVDYINGAYSKIKKLQTAEVKAKWIYVDYTWRCSNCNHSPTQFTGCVLSKEELKDYHFCRFCGATMIGIVGGV